jgi:hypothetical protein
LHNMRRATTRKPYSRARTRPYIAQKAAGAIASNPQNEQEKMSANGPCYFTTTRNGSDAIPFATTSNKLGPRSCFVETSTCVETSASDATAMLL